MENSNFTSVEELIDNVARGGEIEFEYAGKQYSISHSSEGIHIMQFYNYSTEQIYKLSSEIVEYKINDKNLGSIVRDLIVTFRCFH